MVCTIEFSKLRVGHPPMIKNKQIKILKRSINDQMCVI